MTQLLCISKSETFAGLGHLQVILAMTKNDFFYLLLFMLLHITRDLYKQMTEVLTENMTDIYVIYNILIINELYKITSCFSSVCQVWERGRGIP
jgi:hypothetical protein